MKIICLSLILAGCVLGQLSQAQSGTYDVYPLSHREHLASTLCGVLASTIKGSEADCLKATDAKRAIDAVVVFQQVTDWAQGVLSLGSHVDRKKLAESFCHALATAIKESKANCLKAADVEMSIDATVVLQKVTDWGYRVLSRNTAQRSPPAPDKPEDTSAR